MTLLSEEGTYASFDLQPTAAAKLYAFVAEILAPYPVELQAPEKYHITTAYSRTKIDIEPEPFEFAGAVAVGYEYLGREGDDPVIVLRVEHAKLHDRHNAAMAAGGTHDFPEYLPHITLTKKVPNRNLDLSRLPLPAWLISLGTEKYESLREHVETTV